MKNFTITKNKFKKPESKAPDYRISVKVGEKFEEIGGCWLKDSKDGQKYFSCKLNDVWVDHTKGIAKKGFVLIDEAELNKLASQEIKEPQLNPEEDPDNTIPF